MVRCDLQIALGDALHHARDRRHRAVLAAAAEGARRLGDARRLAEVALAHNLGFARPTGRTDEALVALAEEALAALPPSDDPLRARLLAVLALELAWSTDGERRRELIGEADAMARRLGDPHVLTRVLVLRRWADTDPDDLTSRRSAAYELVALAEELGDAEAASAGHLWQVMCHLEEGDVSGAVAEVEAAWRDADQLRNPVLEAELAAGRTITALLLGRLDDAERLMHEARDLALLAGLPPRTALGWFAAHSFLLRYELGQPDEALGALEEFRPFMAESGTAEWVWRATSALLYAEAGDRAAAHQALAALIAADPATFARHMTWIPTLVMAGRAAAALEDAAAAATLYPLLAPYAGRTAWVGAAVFGPVDPVLALLAATLQRGDDADAHFARAVDLCRRRGMPTWLARTRCQWAGLLSVRGRPGDAARARVLAAEALAGAQALRMAGVAARSAALLST